MQQYYENKTEPAPLPRREDAGQVKRQTTVCPSRRSQITEAFDLLENALFSLNDRVDALQERVSPVLRSAGPSSPCDEKLAKAPISPLAPIAAATNTLTDRAMNVCRRVDDILDRLEL